MSDTEINGSPLKLSNMDVNILDRFQDRVTRIEFVRDASKCELKTVLHILPSEDLRDD